MNSLKKLQQKWYKKLEQSGFKDIEDDKGRLKTYSSAPWKNIESTKTHSSRLAKESKEEYYRLASQYFWEKEFNTALDKKIWKFHSMGYTLMFIAKTLGMSKGAVQYHIDSMRKEFFK